MGLFGLILFLIGILISGSGIGLIFGVPLIVLGLILMILAMLKGGISALFRLGAPKKD